MASPGRAAEVMRRLRAIGVKISIDDFGTGHSSLAYLTTLPNDELKVDKSFIQAMSTDPNAETVVRAIVDLAAQPSARRRRRRRRDRRGRRGAARDRLRDRHRATSSAGRSPADVMTAWLEDHRNMGEPTFEAAFPR